MTDEPSPSTLTPHLIAVDSTALRPCPQCSAKQWLQGLTYLQCAACGYRDGLTPQEILGQREGAS